ncbi:extracellular solute-binding protein [Deinococcus radiopugnans]|uniref:extracellular solute-binding protein n=1 Tax=Deinococcus radiopugnans TaxID=57497 RepID=UPI0036136151
MRKRVLLLSALLFPALSTASAQQKITLTWWINPWRIAPPGFPEGKTPTGEEFPKYISDQFMKKYPNVTVKYEVVPNQGFREKVTASIFAGNPPTCCAPSVSTPTWSNRTCWSPSTSTSPQKTGSTSCPTP